MRCALGIALLVLLVGCSSPSSTSMETPPSVEGATVADFTKGLEDSDELKQFREIADEQKKSPDDLEAQLNYAGGLIYVGSLQAEAKQSQRAKDCFAEAAKILDRLEDKKGVEVEQLQMFGRLRFALAHSQSEAGQVDETLTSLNKAVELGFSDFDRVEKDEAFQPLLERHGFEKLAAGWEETATKVGKEHAGLLLKSATSFPFDFEVKDLDGQTHRLADYEGSVLIVDIWGTWCPPCRMEIPHFVKLVKEHGPDDFKMLGLNYREDSDEDVKDFIKQMKINYPCSIQEGEPTDVPDFEGYPTTLFFDRQGKVRLKVVGYHSYYLLNGVVTTLLAEK